MEPTRSSDFRISGELEAVGWIAATISARGSEVNIRASYMGDALADIARAAIALAQPTDAVQRVLWAHEPGYWKWWLIRTPNSVQVAITKVTEELDPEGPPVFEATVSYEQLASAVARSMRTIIDTVGDDGYRELWYMHPFPHTELAQLETILDDLH